MKYFVIIIFLVTLPLFGKKSSCYSVELLSVKRSQSYKIDLQSYPDICQKIEIGSYTTIRCGCIERYKEIKPLLKKLKRRYKYAYVASTYRYRFSKKEKFVPAPVLTPVVLEKSEVFIEEQKPQIEEPKKEITPVVEKEPEIVVQKQVQPQKKR